MAYPNDCIPPQAVVDLANKDTNRLVGEVGKFELQSDPYMNLVGDGTLPNVSTVVRSVTAERALPGSSLVRPVFVNSEAACGMAGNVTQVGSTEFTFQLQTLRERGPKICVKTTRTAWPGSYAALLTSLKQSIREVNAADIRAVFLDSGGLKLVADSTATFSQAFSGDINAVGTNFANRTPDSPISFRALEYLATYMRETLGVDPYEGEGDEGSMMAVFGQDQIQNFRDEAEIKDDLRALTTGRYKMGEDTISGYRFKGPYHAIAFGIDRRPLRFSTMTAVANGAVDPRTGIVNNTGATYNVPNLIEPYVPVATTKGVSARPNSNWTSAQYEIGFLVGYNGFKRLVPESYKTPGFDFQSPISNQGLKFKLLEDADCNFWGDFGQHMYEIERAFQPVHPHAIAAIAFKRCTGNLGLTTC
jgi:hypothetical protein